MPGLLAQLIARLCLVRHRPPGAAATGLEPIPAADARRDRRLADAIDRAMDLGLWAHADRIAATAARLPVRSARLVTTLARLHLARGRPKAALSILDTRWRDREAPSRVRLLRAACLLRDGRAIRARRFVERWSRATSAPMEARLLHSLLESGRGDEHAAALTLLHDLRHSDDRRALELLLLIAVSAGRHEHAKALGRRLAELTTIDSELAPTALLSRSLGVPVPHPRPELSPRQIDRLAAELVAEERTMPALVAAQRRRPHPVTARLLARSIERGLEDFADRPRAIESIARLALASGDLAGARLWAERGRQEHPMSAALTLLARELAEDDTVPPRADERPMDDVLATIGRTNREKAA